jgi:MYXO-CTERM domain-containing protein
MSHRQIIVQLSVALFAFVWAQDAQGIITRDDVPDASYVVADSDYPAVVDLFEPGDCIGTLITTQHLLTVAHCAEDLTASGTLSVGGTSYSIAQVTLHPDWNDWDNDIALIRFEDPTTGITPYELFAGTDEQGQSLILVGRGPHATGLEGEPGATTDGQLRRATNLIASADGQWLEVRFDSPQEAAVTELEGVGAAGDSGGPAFIETTDGLQLAGLNSWGDPAPGGAIGQYGGTDHSTRVSYFADWIQGEISNPTAGNDAGQSCACSASPGKHSWVALLLFVGLLMRRSI